MLAPAAAGPVLELVDEIHSDCAVFVFSLQGSFCFCLCCCFSLPLSTADTWSPALALFGLRSGGSLLWDRRFRPPADGPDEAQQFTSHGGNNLALVLAGRGQPGIALVQA